MNERIIKRLFAAAAAAAFGLSAQAVTYTWTGGGGDTDFATGANWQGGVAPGASEAGVDLVFPEAGATVTGLGTRAVNAIELQGGTVTLKFGSSGGTFTVNGAISGPGGLTSVGGAAASEVVLAAASTFSGGYFNDGGRTTARVSGAFGTGPVKIKSNSLPSFPLKVEGSACTFANDFTIGLEGTAAIGTLYAATPVTFTGKVTFSGAADMRPSKWNGNFRICSYNSSAVITFEGPVETTNSDYAFLPDGGVVKFASQIVQPMSIDFNSGRSVEFCASANNVTFAGFNNWGGGDATFLVSADNPFLDGKTKIAFGKTWGNKLFNLNGHPVTVKSVYELQSTFSGSHEVTSATPATLTIKDDEADRTFYGKFTGALSLDYDSPERTYTLANGVSTLTGALRVSSGAVVLKDLAAMDAISSLEVNGRLTVDATAGAFGGQLTGVTIGTDGALDLGGRRIKVYSLAVGGETKAKGIYTAAELPDRLANGEIEVLCSGDEWTWTGAAGGVWSTPGNWTVGGQPATVTPPEDAVLFIAAATNGAPFIVEGAKTTIANPMVLGIGQQLVRFTTNAGALVLNGRITGMGGFRFTCETGTATEKLYSVRFGNAANDFSGGVRRSDGGQLVLSSGYGTGRVTVDTGSNNGSGVSNYVPLTTDLDGLVFTNDLTVGRESYQNWNGWWKGAKTVRFTGKVDFVLGSGPYDQTRYVDATTTTFDGPVSISGRLICKAGAKATFNAPIRKSSGTCALYADNGSFTGRIACPSNEVTNIYFGNVDQWKWFFDVPDAVPAASISMEGVKSPNNATFDLCGNDQHVKDVYYSSTTNAAAIHAVHFTSDAPATLTVANTAHRLFGGTFDGGVSVVFAPEEAYTNTLSGATHSTTGSLTVAAGTVVCTEGTRFAALAAADVSGGAALRLEDAKALNRKATVRLADTARLDLAFTGEQRVRELEVGGVSVAPGLYGAEDNAAAPQRLATIKGTGLLLVTGRGLAVIVR